MQNHNMHRPNTEFLTRAHSKVSLGLDISKCMNNGLRLLKNR